ncbi:MAG TPA: hypothetical protein VGM96_18410 [Reyranella sp.]|jgi:hypothetical protein
MGQTIETREPLSELENNPVCSVLLDSDVPCLTVVWKRQGTSAQLRALHERLLELLRKYKIHKILGDDTALPLIEPDDQAWIVQDWMPRAVAAGLKLAANKSPEAYFGRLAVETIKASQSLLAIRSFEHFDEARRWLKNARV